MPSVSPVTAIGLAVPMAVMPPGFEVTEYEVIGVPPSLNGAWKLTVACASPAVACGNSGWLGTTLVVGVTEFDGPEVGPLPATLLATMVNVYATPLLSPLTWMGLLLPVFLMPPGLEVTV